MSVVSPPPVIPPEQDELEALIREARARQRKRWLGAAALVAFLAGGAFRSPLDYEQRERERRSCRRRERACQDHEEVRDPSGRDADRQERRSGLPRSVA